MPELPEVELVARSLNELVCGRRIAEAALIRPRLAPHTLPNEFAERLSGAGIRLVHRRGKHVLFDFDNGETLIVHLRMSGRFLLLGGDHENPKFTHAIFDLGDGDRLVFEDQRHFGLMKITPTHELLTAKEIAKLAPEPFSEEFSADYLYTSLRRSNRSLKEFLLDQTKVCGLGNIYAAEAMFLAGVHPAKIAARLSRKRTEALYATIRYVLAEAIEAGSTLNTDPQNPEIGYYGGRYEDYWRVYGRENRPCPNCQSPIVRLKQAGRSSYFCPRCQRK
ncbi:MAG: bifunctional DNA-formamidopyrimidine glycosylase/DNA-(apurinic or apyrimidinic site) lyase [Acidobacteriota bacterium]